MSLQSDKRLRSIAPLLLAALILAAFSPLIQSDFINYDDPLYVTGNVHVKAGLTWEGVIWAFTSFHAYNWHPLTWISHMVDVSIFAMNPSGHHLANVVIHLCNSLLLFALLRRMTGSHWRSLFVAALFALHPMHVESVAWVAERKDLLCAFFFLLAIWAYTYYVERPGLWRYLNVMAIFALGLMAKPMAVTLPVVLLLLDYWPLGRFISTRGCGDDEGGRGVVLPILLEKIPLLLIAVVSGIVTYLAQQQGGAIARDGSLAAPFGNALISYVKYLIMAVWPTGLSVFYPFDPTSVTLLKAAAAGVALTALTLFALWGARRRGYLATGWLWYLLTLLPVIGFVRIGKLAMADRYTYLPFVGIFVIVAWALGELNERVKWREPFFIAPLLVVLCSLSAATWIQAGHWRNSTTLFRHAVSVTEGNWLAHKNLASSLAGEGDLHGALRHVTESLRIKPDPDLYVSKGWLEMGLGFHRQSLRSCGEAIAASPENDRAHFICGMDHLFLRNFRSASMEYNYLRKAGSPFAAALLEEMKRSGFTPLAGD